MTARLQDKVAVVTGAAQGIGRGVAERFAAEGAHLVLADRSELVNEVRLGHAVVCDLEHYAGAVTLMDAALAAHGRIDILVNNVGGTIWAKPYDHYEEEQIEAEIRRSLFPTLWCCHAVLPAMIAQKSGTIVNVSSVATKGLNRVPYAASKGGVNALTAGLAWEYAEHGIRVNAVAPGITAAPPRRIPRNEHPDDGAGFQVVVEQSVASTHMKRYGTIEEQVAAILFLASDEASYITGTVLPVAGGDQG